MNENAWRLTLVNNMPSHHQMPLARELHRILGGRFRCVFVSPMDAERAGMRWSDPSAGAGDWVIRAWESQEAMGLAREATLTADAALLCTLWSYPPVPAWARERLGNGRLTLGFAESRAKPALRRPQFKNGMPAIGPLKWVAALRARKGLEEERRTYASPHCHFLSIGARAAEFEAKRGNFGDRMWKYGYFTEVPDETPRPRPRDSLRVFYAGRLLPWKRVDDLVQGSSMAIRRGARLQVEIVGEGVEGDRLRALADSLGIAPSVTFRPFQPTATIRETMRASHVLFLGSTEEEGWGAVVNEGMSEGCVPVVSSGCGAGTYLVENGRSGLKYDTGNVKNLAAILVDLAADLPGAERLGRQAWEYVHAQWSPGAAAERVVRFCGDILAGAPPPRFAEGPLSHALKESV
jgi:glycosyltransferase involved in cell wall biosynthesis